MTDNPNTGLLKTRDLLGTPLISLQGEEVGSVTRVIVDPANGSIAGLTVNVKGWFKGEKGIEFESVKSFGEYAVTVSRADQVVPLSNLPTLEKLAQDYNIYNMRIITPDGKLIGTIDDYYFNIQTGQIEKYILTGGVIKNLFQGRASIPASSIDKIGKDVVIATANVEETLQKEESGIQDNLENLKGDLENWKDDFENIWEKTRAKTLELSKTMGENLKEAAKTGKDTGEKILSKTGKILVEKKEVLKTSYDSWMDRLQTVKNGPEKPLTETDINALAGLKAGETVTDDSGNVIIEKDDNVSPDVIAEAQKAGKTKELLISVATRDLEDQIKSIEQETEKE